MKYKIEDAARRAGVSESTLRRWDREGKVTAERTPGGHRRYGEEALARIYALAQGRTPADRITLAYARVSTHEQRPDLVRQTALLSEFCTRRGWVHEVIEDTGSGLNYHKKGLRLLLRRLCDGDVGRLVITHKDRLLRFGAELIFALCAQFGTEVVVINQGEVTTAEEDLARDVLEIITVFSARLYGARSRKNRELLTRLRNAAGDSGGTGAASS